MLRKLFIYEDLDKIISDNILRINKNVKEYDSYFFFKLSVLNFEIIIFDIELFEVCGLEISLEDRNCFESKIIVDKVFFIFRLLFFIFMKIRLFF